MKKLSTILSENNFFSKPILVALIDANKALAELKGISYLLPNTTILVNTLSLQEAKSSSEVENIITTQDELYQSNYLQNYQGYLKRKSCFMK